MAMMSAMRVGLLPTMRVQYDCLYTVRVMLLLVMQDRLGTYWKPPGLELLNSTVRFAKLVMRSVLATTVPWTAVKFCSIGGLTTGLAYWRSEAMTYMSAYWT